MGVQGAGWGWGELEEHPPRVPALQGAGLQGDWRGRKRRVVEGVGGSGWGGGGGGWGG